MWHQGLIDLVGATMAGALSFSPFAEIGPHPPPAPPESTPGPAPRIERHPLPRASTFRTLLGYQLPPRAVATPRSLRASAICCSVVAPALRTCFMIGSTV